MEIHTPDETKIKRSKVLLNLVINVEESMFFLNAELKFLPSNF